LALTSKTDVFEIIRKTHKMYRGKKIGLVIPAYREEKLIRPTLLGVPGLFDRVYVVDDCSPDGMAQVVQDLAANDPRICLIRHTENQGPGGAIISGYLKAAEENCDVTVVIGGDNQMQLSEAERFLDPVIDGKADYAKGNRFLMSRLEDTLSKMPKIRLIGNWIITGLTKIASGHYKVMDVVDGYTAISKQAIDYIDWSRAWKKYGYPMDFLIRLNAYGFKVLDVPRTAVYLPGERQSQIKGFKYAMSVSPMLVKGFFWRLKFRYLYRDFHPLVLFYYLSFLLLGLGFAFGLYMVGDKIFSDGAAVTGARAMLASLAILTGLQLFLFAMFFDMQESRQNQ
jgi:glycosyltransferase involved in cell wall biosynthesis